MANKMINKSIGEFKKYNAECVLLAVEKWIRILEIRHKTHYKWQSGYKARMWEVCDELSIFDWWVDDISISRLKEMRTFLKEAIKLGFTGYVCFKVGVTGCANGMWAHKDPTTNGYSPDCDFLYRSFTPAYTYWDITYADEKDYNKNRLTYKVGKKYDEFKTAKALEKALKEVA